MTQFRNTPPEKKRRRTGLLWFLVIVLAAGLLSAVYIHEKREDGSLFPSTAGEEQTETSASGSEGNAGTTAEGEASGGDAAVADVPYPEGFSLADVPAYSGEPFCEVNGNQPFFTEADYAYYPAETGLSSAGSEAGSEKSAEGAEIQTSNTGTSRPGTAWEACSPLDELGRCGPAMGRLDRSLMPTAERGPIGDVRPSGWHTVKYAGIDQNYLYNRCHLLGFQLTGENANEHNLITGTRYMNTEGMEPFENMAGTCIRYYKKSVLYRVTPVFSGDELVARGVLMEARSIEDDGENLCFCVFCYNVQPGVTIDYSTGESEGPEYVQESPEENEAG